MGELMISARLKQLLLLLLFLFAAWFFGCGIFYLLGVHP